MAQDGKKMLFDELDPAMLAHRQHGHDLIEIVQIRGRGAQRRRGAADAEDNKCQEALHQPAPPPTGLAQKSKKLNQL